MSKMQDWFRLTYDIQRDVYIGKQSNKYSILMDASVAEQRKAGCFYVQRSQLAKDLQDFDEFHAVYRHEVAKGQPDWMRYAADRPEIKESPKSSDENAKAYLISWHLAKIREHLAELEEMLDAKRP